MAAWSGRGGFAPKYVPREGRKKAPQQQRAPKRGKQKRKREIPPEELQDPNDPANQYVVHCQKDAYDVYIGRKNPKVDIPESDIKWGNPFKIGKDLNRADVIRLYKEWLLNQPELMQVARDELAGKILACWCSPKQCHGHVLAAVANSLLFPSPAIPDQPQRRDAPVSFAPATLPDGRPSITVYCQHDTPPADAIKVNATSRSKEHWSKGLSPFFLGPIHVDVDEGTMALNMENAWQYAKVYDCHVDTSGNPTKEYWEWARAGWSDPKPRRFPMGKGTKPLYSMWKGRHLGYVEARMRIYAPLYAEVVQTTQAFKRLKTTYKKAQELGVPLAIFDYDGHNSIDDFSCYRKILYNEAMKMGHGFVLAMLLEEMEPWREEYHDALRHQTRVQWKQ